MTPTAGATYIVYDSLAGGLLAGGKVWNFSGAAPPGAISCKTPGLGAWSDVLY